MHGRRKKECDLAYPYELLEDNCAARFDFDDDSLIWEDITHKKKKSVIRRNHSADKDNYNFVIIQHNLW